jgi:hypothetical protein
VSTVASLVQRFPVASYAVLTFGLSWGAVLIVIGGPAGIPADAERLEALLPLVVLGLTVGPVVAGLALTGLARGAAGYATFLARARRWRVGPGWYAVALLTAPGLAIVTLGALSLASPAFTPGIVGSADRAALVLGAIVAGLAAGLLEEPGWTGFAVPEMRRRHGLVATGLAIGALWGGWHLIVAVWGSGTPSGAFSVALLGSQLVFYVGVLPAYRVLMAWVFERTDSLPVAMLMHASLTGGVLFVFMPAELGPGALALWYGAMTLATWLLVAWVAFARGRRRSARARTRRSAGGAAHRPPPGASASRPGGPGGGARQPR